MEENKYSDQEKLCLKMLREQNVDLVEVLKRTTSKSINHLDADWDVFTDVLSLHDEFLEKGEDFIRTEHRKMGQVKGHFEQKAMRIVDILQRLSSFNSKKTEIEGFLMQNNGRLDENWEVWKTMVDNRNRVADVRKKLLLNITPIAGFEREDVRISEVFRRLLHMIRVLPMNENEKMEMEEEVERVAQNAELSGKGKIEMVVMHLLALVGTWQNPPIIDDSNLADLDGDLRTVRVKKAINEPFEMENFSTASNLTENDASLEMHTARSEEESIIEVDAPAPTPTRRCSELQPDAATGVNFANISLTEMIGDVIHSAKHAAETQATSVLETIQKSVFPANEKIEL